mgnify:CR=1 FL=1
MLLEKSVNLRKKLQRIKQNKIVLQITNGGIKQQNAVVKLLKIDGKEILTIST